MKQTYAQYSVKCTVEKVTFTHQHFQSKNVGGQLGNYINYSVVNHESLILTHQLYILPV